MVKQYHPDDCPDLYLGASDVRRAVAAMRAEARKAEERATLELITEHERIHRAACSGELGVAEAAAAVEALAQGFRTQYGDWVHNRTGLYWKFYRALPKLGILPIGAGK